jgi:hypothetical protein
MMTEQQLLEEGYAPALARIVSRVLKDVQKIHGFELIQARPWKSNLGKIMPNIGDRIETEIRNYIQGQEIILTDQRRREVSNNLEQIHDEYGNPYISTEWINQNILKNK